MSRFSADDAQGFSGSAVKTATGMMALTVAVALLAPGWTIAADVPTLRYSPDVTYEPGMVVVSADGNAYRAVRAVSDVDPAMAGAEDWELAHAARPVVLDVPGRFKTIQSAFKYLSNATLADKATIVVQLAPGEYDLGPGLEVPAIAGGQTILRGIADGEKPEAKSEEYTVFVTGQRQGIAVRDRNSLSIEGITLEGRRESKIGVDVEGGGHVRLTHCRITGFDCGVSVSDPGSILVAENCQVTTSQRNGWATGYRAIDNGKLVATKCSATRQGDRGDRTTKVGFGFSADGGGIVRATDCSAAGWQQGYRAVFQGSIGLRGCDAAENTDGCFVDFGSVTASESNFHDNAESGLAVSGGSAWLDGCVFQKNKQGISALHFAGVKLAGDNQIRQNDVGLFSFAGGRFVLGRAKVAGNKDDMKIHEFASDAERVFQPN